MSDKTLKDVTKASCATIAEAADLASTTLPTDAETTAADVVGRQLGGDLAAVGKDVLEMIAGAPGSFAGRPELTKQIEADVKAYAQITDAQDQVGALAEGLDGRFREVRARLARNINVARRIKDATLDNPAVGEDAKAALRGSARRLDRRAGERAARTLGRRAATVALKQHLGKRIDDTQTDATAKQLRISELELQNQYLSGERLRPSELVVPQATAPRTKTRRATKAQTDDDVTPPASPGRRRSPR